MNNMIIPEMYDESGDDNMQSDISISAPSRRTGSHYSHNDLFDGPQTSDLL